MTRLRWPAILAVGLLVALLGACGSPAPAPTESARAAKPTERPAAAAAERKPTATPEEDEDESEGPKPGSAPTATPRPLPTSTVSGLNVELVAEGLILPQSLTFAPDGRLFFVEVKKGDLRVMSGRTLQSQPVVNLPVARGAEHGLVSVALDPGFERNHYLYTFYTQAVEGDENGRPRRNRLTRWTESNGVATDETPILNDLPVGKCCHTGGKMAFAADGSLFLTVGDQGDADRRDAQKPNKLNGKILHFDVEQVLQEHPDPLSLVYASGLRNPYGIDLHPVTGAPFVTDNGPDMCDELNLGHEGANYGNPAVECSAHDARYDDPAWESGVDRLGVTGLRVYHGSMFPELVNHPLFCSVNTGNLMHAVLSSGFDRVERVEQVVSGQDGEGCRLDLAVAPDGAIYYTSMTKIFRLSR